MIRKGLITHFSFIKLFIISTPVFIISLYISRYSHPAQVQTVVIAAIFYLLASYWHHFQDKTLSWEIVVEYLLIALLAVVTIQYFLI